MNENETTWLSPVQIIDSPLLAFDFDFNISPEQSDHAGPLSFTLDAVFDDPEQGDETTTCVGVVKFEGEWEGKQEGETLFTILCVLGIAIDVDNNVLDGEINGYTRQIKANALALAYGKIRSIIESITAQSMVGKQVIPAINAQAYFESND